MAHFGPFCQILKPLSNTEYNNGQPTLPIMVSLDIILINKHMEI